MHTRVMVAKGDICPSFGIDDRIFLGEGLFETIRVDSSKPCFDDLHWKRLSNSAIKLGIPFDLSVEDWHEYLVQQIKCDNLYHGGIKAILSGGVAPRGLTEQGQVSQLIFRTFNYTINHEPVRLISSPWLRDGKNPVYQIKSVNYLEAIIARRQALTEGADDVLFFNYQNHATETTCANLFVIKNNTLFTPELSDGVLPGVTRLRLLMSCEEQGIPCIEAAINKAMIEDAEAVFITNSLQGIRPVLALDTIVYSTSHPLLDRINLL